MGEYGFEIINQEEMTYILGEKQVLVIDLREPEEYKKKHIKGAKNFPFSLLDEWRGELPDKIDIILYCEHGNQSMLAARRLVGRQGMIYTLKGGIERD